MRFSHWHCLFGLSMPSMSEIAQKLSPKNLFKKIKTAIGCEDMENPEDLIQFPDTLEEFGYHFSNGELRTIDTDEKFNFVVKEGDHHYNQMHYEALGKVIEKHIYALLEKDCGLLRLPVPSLDFLEKNSTKKIQNIQPKYHNQTDDAKAAASGKEKALPGKEPSNISDSAVDRHPSVGDESLVTEESSPADNLQLSQQIQSGCDDSKIALESSTDNQQDVAKSQTQAIAVDLAGMDHAESTITEQAMENESVTSTGSPVSLVDDPSTTVSTQTSCTNEPEGFMFASEGWNKQDKLLVLIHGSGVVRAGQWARRLIINDNLDTGTQIPFIKEGLQLGYGIIVMNTNHNRSPDGHGSSRPIMGSESPVAHARSVWRDYVMPSAALHVAVVAHSYGGVVTTSLFQEFTQYFEDKVFAVAFTDSVHSSPLPKTFGHFLKISRNWVTSSEPLDTRLRLRGPRDVVIFSAGVQSHEMTSSASMKSIFKFFSERLALPTSMDVDLPDSGNEEVSETFPQEDSEVAVAEDEESPAKKVTKFEDKSN
ncbi:cotranscriptional regulator FAM172A isoform X2 [Hyalella azteca]|uniref:Cotranscriptional regulator FAM172A isoform X2 n=1 Tax=Hyalella azteca TaxID=294128 RepID=A0A8B7PFV0_HYAAZ|nr:cotranscriptional regulator FAM172A isoform X2 [Hyalella azteca]